MSDAHIFQPDWATLRVHGPDAASWLNGIITCNVLSVKDGVGAWGCLLTKQGKIQAELQIVGNDSELFLGVSGGAAEQVLETLDGYLVMEDAEIEEVEGAWLVALGGEAKDALPNDSDAQATLPWGRVDATAAFSRTPTDRGERSNESWVRERTRLGLPTYGVDYTSSDNLHAASLERKTVDWSKGCYLGQEVVCMQDMRGKVRHRLVHLKADEGELSDGAPVTLADSGEEVGVVKSVAGAYGIARVATPYDQPGTDVAVNGLRTVVSALA